MPRKSPTTIKRYQDLTVEQAFWVLGHYPANTDPYQYEYEVDSKGRVVDRYKITEQVKS